MYSSSESDPVREWLHSRVVAQLPLQRWELCLVLFGVGSQAFTAWEQYHRLESGERLWLFDHVIFEYIGWFVTRGGGRLYLDIWEVKPPLSFEIPALLAVTFGGDIYVYHLANIVLTNLVLVGTPLVIGLLVVELTDDVQAGLLAGIALYVMPRYHWRATIGFKSKYYVLFAGFLALYLHYRDRPLASGIAGGAAVGFWQLGAVFPLLTGALALQHEDRGYQTRLLAGFVVAGVLIVAPVVLFWQTTPMMIAEVVLGPFIGTETATAAERLQKAIDLLGMAFPVFLLGVVGSLWGLGDNHHVDRWWLPAGIGLYAALVIFFDLDRYPDLFPVFAFAVVGVGIVLGRSSDAVRPLGSLIVVLAVLNIITVGGFGAGQPTPLKGYDTYTLGEVEGPVGTSGPLDGEVRQYVFWETVPVESCRAFYGPSQKAIAEKTGIPSNAKECGDLDRYWDVFKEKYGLFGN